MVYIIILAFVIWMVSWVVRRKKPELGIKISWVATGIAVVGLIYYLVARFFQ